jgi:hypothetical protein
VLTPQLRRVAASLGVIAARPLRYKSPFTCAPPPPHLPTRRGPRSAIRLGLSLASWLGAKSDGVRGGLSLGA